MVLDVDSIHPGGHPNSVHYQVSSPAESCPILNYVHHSSNILRKVRLGQSLDVALHSVRHVHVEKSSIEVPLNSLDTPLFPQKPLLQSPLKLRQELRSKNMELADAAVTPPVSFRRERGLHPLQGMQVRHARQPLDSQGVLYKRNQFLPADVPIHLKTYKNFNYIVPENNKTNSDDTSRLSCLPPDQHNAALIIARFFRSVCRLDNAADRAREVLRRRWREQHPEKYRTPLFELTNNEQLRVLQLYNPHLYGSQHAASPLGSTSTSIRLARVPQMEQQKRMRQLQILARMDRETELLNETCRQKTQTPTRATTRLHDAYQRQPLASQERPRTVLGHERLQQTHDLIAFAKTPPNFRYKTTSQSRLLANHTLKSASTVKPLNGSSQQVASAMSSSSLSS